jgi:transposase
MILDTESWMNIRRFRALHAAGATFAEIGRECGCDWRTVRKYLAEDAASVPPSGPARTGCQPLLITPFMPIIEAWLRADLRLKGTVIHERLVADYGFTGHYQRVKMCLAEARPRIAAELEESDDNPLTGLHRRFEVIPGAQAQVDWGDEGDLLAHTGIPTVYSFHMVLSHSRDPFCCFTTSMDLATFWDCHRRAFAHFGGVPGTIVYDRTKTVIRRHVAPGLAVPLHSEAAAFADHYGFTIDVLAAYRPTGKGRVERQVNIVWNHVIAGRSFDSIAELDGAFVTWLPIRRSQVHRTHGQVIAVRAQADRAALRALPDQPCLVAEKHLRRVGERLSGLLRSQLLLRPRVSDPARATSPAASPPRPCRWGSGEHPRPDRRRRRLAGHPSAGHDPRIVGDRAGALGAATRRTHAGHDHSPRSCRAGAARVYRAAVGPADPTACRPDCRRQTPHRLHQSRQPEGGTVSTLTADRIRNHATRLGLTHLTDTLTELVDRAEARWATSISSTCCWRKRSASAKAAGSATR